MLRPDLYARLKEVFKHVRVSNEGAAMQATVVRSALTKKPELQIRDAGEYYVVNCPFCLDTGHRLWINHRWGFYDARNDSRNLWLAICYNEDCLNVERRPQLLFNQVFNDVGDGQDVILPGSKSLSQAEWNFRWPGKLTDLEVLARNLPDSSALTYLRSRGFDPVQLSQWLKVQYCMEADPDFLYTAGRIIIPVIMNGKYRGWQARVAGEPRYNEPKYYSMLGMKKTQLLYNFDAARKCPFVIVCEGPTDVWRVGPASVALFGKTLSATQKTLLAANWGQGAVIVLLDGDAGKEARAIYDSLAGLVSHRVLVQLPDGADPGSLTTEEIAQLIAKAAKEQDVDLEALTHAKGTEGSTAPLPANCNEGASGSSC